MYRLHIVSSIRQRCDFIIFKKKGHAIFCRKKMWQKKIDSEILAALKQNNITFQEPHKLTMLFLLLKKQMAEGRQIRVKQCPIR